jgi:hypothetical protein
MKFKLLENVFVGFSFRDGTYYIYINPTSQEMRSKEDSKNNRGIIDKRGNLYMEARWLGDEKDHDFKYSSLIHEHMLNELHKKGKFLEVDNDWWTEGSDVIKYAVFVQRLGSQNVFYLAESYAPELFEEDLDIEVVSEFFNKAEAKNPHLTFHFESIVTLGEENEI